MYYPLVHFLCLPKENEPKEKAPVSLGPADFLALLKTAGSLKTRFRSNSSISLIGSFSGAQLRANGNLTTTSILARLPTVFLDEPFFIPVTNN